ncbi:hypothetical protein LT493_19180 [Streptomyces tricolor]|nr:hypothetical protein [Streptomyces tricolor]
MLAAYADTDDADDTARARREEAAQLLEAAREEKTRGRGEHGTDHSRRPAPAPLPPDTGSGTRACAARKRLSLLEAAREGKTRDRGEHGTGHPAPTGTNTPCRPTRAATHARAVLTVHVGATAQTRPSGPGGRRRLERRGPGWVTARITPRR